MGNPGPTQRIVAVRHFSARPVAPEDLDAIIEAARWTGSARNRQPWRFLVVRDPEVRRALSRCGSYAQHLAGAPVAIALALEVVRGGLDGPFDMGRAAQSLMAEAARRGLGTCPATLHPAANVDRAGRLLGLEEGVEAHWAISLGHPAPPPTGTPGGRSAIPRGRRPLGEVRRDLG